MKILFELKSIDDLYQTPYDVGIIISHMSVSAHYQEDFSIDTIQKIINIAEEQNRSVYLNATRIILPCDLPIVESYLDIFSKMNFSGYFVSDLAYFILADKYHFENKLIYRNLPALASVLDVDAWFTKGIQTGIISPDLSLVEIQQLVSKTNNQISLHIFGHYPIFYSRRKLLTNYESYYHIDESCEDIELIPELRSDLYPLQEDMVGTTIYTSGIYNLFDELLELPLPKIKYGIITNYRLSNEQLIKVINIYHQLINHPEDNQRLWRELFTLNLKLYKGLLYHQGVSIKELTKSGGIND